MSLFAMNYGGSIPEPLLPPNIALQNPHLMDGKIFSLFPKINSILVMIDQDGDENYQPMLIPIEGGWPQPVFKDELGDTRVHCEKCDSENNLAYFVAESRKDQLYSCYRADLKNNKLTKICASAWGAYPAANNPDHKKVILIDTYTTGDNILSLWEEGKPELTLLQGIPLEQRIPDQPIKPLGINAVNFTKDDKGLLFVCALFDDKFAPAYLDFENPSTVKPVQIEGIVHQGVGELQNIDLLSGNRYLLEYNIDGCSWMYDARFELAQLKLKIENVICGGDAPLANGVLQSENYDSVGDRFALSFSTATSPTQIYTIEGSNRKRRAQHTSEKVLGISDSLLSMGEDASFLSFDDTRISARLYLPSKALDFKTPRPLIYYVHGGPQGQERPDFAWFSMPLIQFLTLNGFAVFVPNVRGSTGYGLNFTRQVDRDWGGKDRLDHIHAMKILSQDPRIDTNRAGVVGRSYGGYMSLMLAGRHPELWKAAVDMFGPYDLVTFLERIPETWKPYYKIEVGDVDHDLKLLKERSPKTYIDNIQGALLVIQGKNDPRVVERESRDLVEHLKDIGKRVDYLMFEDEGHDVLKYENRVRCYNAITEFFKKYLY
ncbi:MAG: prolyl oligopeptidase family serine peptidase [Anaerolineaceae bacterium]|nr:prolyl oligopeptidase family serine peptidase [Anaerolineaceae bacterium]